MSWDTKKRSILYTGSNKATLRKWDITTGTEKGRIRINQNQDTLVWAVLAKYF